MTKKRMVLDIGIGTDIRGADPTKAAEAVPRVVTGGGPSLDGTRWVACRPGPGENFHQLSPRAAEAPDFTMPQHRTISASPDSGDFGGAPTTPK